MWIWGTGQGVTGITPFLGNQRPKGQIITEKVAILGNQRPGVRCIGKKFAKKFGGFKKPLYLCSVIAY